MTDARTLLGELKDGLRWAAAIAGGPAELARLDWLDGALKRTLRCWLGALERLAARLLVALAAGIDPAPPAQPPSSALLARLAADAERDNDPDDDLCEDSRRWRGVRYARAFGLAPRELERAARADRRHCDGPSAAYLWNDRPAAALARRFEALIRIAEQPRRFARKLARRRVRRSARPGAEPPNFRTAAPACEAKAIGPPPRPRPRDTS